jgi:outer membrane immunogenic protein
MKKLLCAAAAVSLLAVAAPAAAQTYGSIGYSNYGIDDVDLGAITGRFGWNSASFFGIEGEASIGVNDDEAGGIETELKTDFGAFVTGRLPVNEQFDVFARVGYTRTEIEDSPGGDADSSNLAWGVGANWFFDDVNGVRFDWTQRDTEDDFGEDTDVWSISYIRRFR